jgi:cytochrome c oxidase cbb3-type subunit 1
MITASTQPADLAEVTTVETAGRCPFLLLIVSGILWLVVSGVLTVLGSIQLVHPSVLAGCSALTYGHTAAMAESAFIYGWIGNLGLAVTLWMLARLSGEPLRAPNWVMAGTSFWNLGLLLGLIGIAFTGATSVPFLELPRMVQPIMLVAYGAIAASGVLAWTGRRRDQMFASQWYAVAALFLFPWIFSAAQVMLFWFPVRGTLQAVVGGWYAQSLWTLWMAPLALAGAYYVIPRVTGKLLPGYDTALTGFWTLLFFGGFTGGRHLIGGPVPAWISSLAIVTAFVLLVHYFIVWLNLRPAWSGGGTSLKFIGLGLFAYLLSGLFDAVTATRSVAELTQFTLLDQAQVELGVVAGISLLLTGALYFAVPRLLGRPWASAGLVTGHLILTILGLALALACLVAGGWRQAHDLADAKVSFGTIADHLRPWLCGLGIGQAILLLGNLLLAFNLGGTVAAMVREEGVQS